MQKRAPIQRMNRPVALVASDRWHDVSMHRKSRRVRISYPVFAHLLPDDTELSPQNKTGKCDCKKAKDEDRYCN